jgi:hypothetical protein
VDVNRSQEKESDDAATICDKFLELGNRNATALHIQRGNRPGELLGRVTGRGSGPSLGQLHMIDAPLVSFSYHQQQLSPSSPRVVMFTVPSTSTSHSNVASIFNAALGKYKRKTEQDLAKHPLLPRLQSCESPAAILNVLQEQIPASSQSQNSDNGLTKWVKPTVNVMYSFSAALGGVAGLVN